MNIRVDLNYPIQDGTEVIFRSPVDCSQVTGLIVYYPGASHEFVFADAHGNNVGDIDHLFAENVVVKVILDVTTSMAFVQNADTNAYIESTFIKSVNGHGPDENGNVEIPTGGSVDLSNYYTKEEIAQLAQELVDSLPFASENYMKEYVDAQIGDISSALDRIIALQEELIGGGYVETITFTIDGVEYTADKGMLWGAWVRSDYNTIGMDIDLQVEGLGFVHLDEQQIETFDAIQAGAEYQLMWG